MLDHDDLFSSIIRNKDNKDSFQDYVKKLVDYCQENNIELLRTVGVVFSNDEKRITQYEK
jgi:predicted CopG family antitoxin